jgi:hypothetical protein
MNVNQHSYEVEFSVHENYFCAHIVAGVHTLDDAARCLYEISYRCRESGKQKLMIENQISHPLMMTYAYRGVTILLDTVPPGTKVAFVHGDDQNRIHFERGVRAAQAEGRSFRVFASVGEAEEWLLEFGDGHNGDQIASRFTSD